MAAFRQLYAVAVRLLLVSVIAFILLQLIPGDPAITLAGENASATEVARLRSELGLDAPLLQQYLDWVGGLVRGDLGTSLPTSQPVMDLVVARLPVTVSLAVVAIIIAVTVGVAIGIVAGIMRGHLVDRAVTLFASLGVAVPPFWFGLVLIIVFALNIGVLPSIGFVPLQDGPVEWLRHLVLPAVALAAAPMAEIARQMRGAMVDVLDHDYVRTARAKGMSGSTVVLKHALKNAAIPVVTVIGLQVSLLLGGSVIVETIFGLPGLGDLVVQSVLQRDIPVVQGVIMVAALVVLVCNLLVDLSYRYFNPRVRVA